MLTEYRNTQRSITLTTSTKATASTTISSITSDYYYSGDDDRPDMNLYEKLFYDIISMIIYHDVMILIKRDNKRINDDVDVDVVNIDLSAQFLLQLIQHVIIMNHHHHQYRDINDKDDDDVLVSEAPIITAPIYTDSTSTGTDTTAVAASIKATRYTKKAIVLFNHLVVICSEYHHFYTLFYQSSNRINNITTSDNDNDNDIFINSNITSGRDNDNNHDSSNKDSVDERPIVKRYTLYQPTLKDVCAVILSCFQSNDRSDNDNDNIKRSMNDIKRENCLLLLKCLAYMITSTTNIFTSTSATTDKSHDNSSKDNDSCHKKDYANDEYDDDLDMIYYLKLLLLISVKIIINDSNTSSTNDITNVITTIIISNIIDYNVITNTTSDIYNNNNNHNDRNIRRIKMICTITMSYIYQLFSAQTINDSNSNTTKVAKATAAAVSHIPETFTLKISLFLFNIWTSAVSKLIHTVMNYIYI